MDLRHLPRSNSQYMTGKSANGQVPRLDKACSSKTDCSVSMILRCLPFCCSPVDQHPLHLNAYIVSMRWKNKTAPKNLMVNSSSIIPGPCLLETWGQGHTARTKVFTLHLLFGAKVKSIAEIPLGGSTDGPETSKIFYLW